MLNNTIKMQSAKCGKFYRINNLIPSTNKRYDDVGLRGRQIKKKKTLKIQQIKEICRFCLDPSLKPPT